MARDFAFCCARASVAAALAAAVLIAVTDAASIVASGDPVFLSNNTMTPCITGISLEVFVGNSVKILVPTISVLAAGIISNWLSFAT